MTGLITRRGLNLGLAGLCAFPAAAARAAMVDPAAPGGSREMVMFGDPATAVGAMAFSHGFGLAPEDYAALIQPWVDHGFVIAAPRHPDSPDNNGKPGAAGADDWGRRLMQFQAAAAALPAHLPLVAAGHSYGGLTALVAGGATPIAPPDFAGPYGVPRLKAVLAFSPPAATRTRITAEGYSTLATPALIQSGDADNFKGVVDDWHMHLLAYDMAPPGDKYALGLEGVNHCFGGAICTPSPSWPGPPRRDRLDQAVAISLLFLDAYGLGRPGAKQKLDAQLSTDLPVMLTRK